MNARKVEVRAAELKDSIEPMLENGISHHKGFGCLPDHLESGFERHLDFGDFYLTSCRIIQPFTVAEGTVQWDITKQNREIFGTLLQQVAWSLSQ